MDILSVNICSKRIAKENFIMAIQIEKSKEDRIIVKFQFSQERVNKIKSIEGREYSPKEYLWTIPCNFYSYNKLIAIFHDEEIKILDDKFLVYLRFNEILKMIEEELKLKGYSFKTRKAYLGHIERFLSYTNKSLKEVETEDIRKYMLYLLDNQKVSHSYVNQAISSLKFACNEVLHQNQVIEFLPRPKKENKLPNVLSFQETIRILGALKNEKHKTILYLIYSAGLRVGEVVRLKPQDIDSERLLIHVVQGKGRKDRYTVLSEISLEQLRKYYKLYKPEKWLFPGQDENEFITERTVQRVFENACRIAKINKKVSVHSLRHSFATHLLEGGIDLRYIQELLGHANSRTTEIYTHVTQKSITNITSPLDRMMKK